MSQSIHRVLAHNHGIGFRKREDPVINKQSRQHAPLATHIKCIMPNVAINLQQPSKPIEGPDNLSWGDFRLHDGLGMIVF